jgi:hypothetical protein
MKKTLMLVIAIVVPVSIYIVLQLFGKNEFTVPAYNQYRGLHCEGKALPEALAQVGPGIKILTFVPADRPSGLGEMYLQIGRAQDALYGNSGVYILSIQKEQMDADTEKNFMTAPEVWRSVHVDTAVYAHLYDCVAGLEKYNAGPEANMPAHITLLDETNAIRGFFSYEPEEIDRLIVETKILLQE